MCMPPISISSVIACPLRFYLEQETEHIDPARLVIQKDVDAAMDPAIPDDAVVFRLVRQSPAESGRRLR